METTQQSGMLTRIERKGEVAATAMSMKARAEVEARYAIALNRPRNINKARIDILDACKRPIFADGAIYRKPVGSGTIDGFSIRFAEEAIKSLGNICVESCVTWEDDEKRNIRITVTDLESNSTYSDDVIIAKTVERRHLKEGQVAISERMNSTGQKVFIVAATEDDMANKANAQKSKVIRNAGLRLVPQDILAEAWDQVQATLKKGGEDPKAATKKVCDSFASLNIGPAELERYLKHPLETISPKELNDLRGIYTAIKEEETTWSAVMDTADPKRPAHTGDPAEQAAANKSAAAAISQTAIEKPYEHLQGLAKEAGVTEHQIHAYMKSVKLAGEKTEELLQATETNMRTVIGVWPTVVQKIKKFPAVAE